MGRVRTRLSITAKLLLWCLALIAIFYATTWVLMGRINTMVEATSTMVNVQHEVGVAVQKMLQQLDTLEENRRRYELLEDDIYMDYVLDDLAEFGVLFNETLQRFPEYRDDWAPLTQEYTITLRKGGDPRQLIGPDETVGSWIRLLEKTRRENQLEMERGLTELGHAAERAAYLGRVGLLAVIVIGLFGSLFIAFRLNRSLSEVMRGIREFGRKAGAAPVRVRSRDEMGELAQAFNRLTARIEREERMRTDFISMLSHEIRTPLTSIRESVDLVAEGTFGEVSGDQKQFLSIARQECDRLSALLKRLMTVASLEPGRIQVSPEPLDPGELAEQALERIRPAAEARSVGLALDVARGLPKVVADSGHAAQVLMNLLGNAVKHSPERGTVTLAASREGNMICFEVRDQGQGVPEEERDMVFQKWYRGKGADVDGAGLGLYISRALVEAHGGSMGLAASTAGDCIFHFTLPVAK